MQKLVENNTIRLLKLPATQSFPTGVWLKPGLGGSGDQSVPDLYFEELRAHKVEMKNIRGDCYDYFPGRAALDELLTPRVYHDAFGSPRRQPAITIYERDQAPLEDKAAWPADLNGTTEKQALAMIKACQDGETLKRWAKTTKDEKVNAALSGALGTK